MDLFSNQAPELNKCFPWVNKHWHWLWAVFLYNIYEYIHVLYPVPHPSITFPETFENTQWGPILLLVDKLFGTHTHIRVLFAMPITFPDWWCIRGRRETYVCWQQHICVFYTFVICTCSCGIVQLRFNMREDTCCYIFCMVFFDNLVFVFLQHVFCDNLKVDHPHQWFEIKFSVAALIRQSKHAGNSTILSSLFFPGGLFLVMSDLFSDVPWTLSCHLWMCHFTQTDQKFQVAHRYN